MSHPPGIATIGVICVGLSGMAAVIGLGSIAALLFVIGWLILFAAFMAESILRMLVFLRHWLKARRARWLL